MDQSQEQRARLLRLELDCIIERQRQLIEELRQAEDQRANIATTPREEGLNGY